MKVILLRLKYSVIQRKGGKKMVKLIQKKKVFLSKPVVITASIILLILVGISLLPREEKVDVESLLERGVGLAREEKYMEAIEIWKQVLNISPGEKRAVMYIEKSKGRIEAKKHLLEAEKLMNEGQHAEAIDELKECLKIHPENEKAQVYLKETMDKLAQNKILKEATDLIDKKSYAEAIRQLEQIGESDTNYFEAQKSLAKAYFQYGLSFYRQEKYQQAINMWQKALMIDPSHHEASQYISNLKQQTKNTYEKGVKQLARGNLTHAHSLLSTAYKLDPSSRMIKNQLIIVTAQLEDAKRYAKSARDNFSTGAWNKAIANWDEVLKIALADEDPLHKEAVEGRKLASEKLNNAIKTQSEKEDNLLNEEKKLAAQFQLESAKYYEQGLTYFKEGDFKNALSQFRHILSLSPNYKDTKTLINQCTKELSRQTKEYYLQGLILEDLDQHKYAKEKWQKAIDIAPDENDEYYQKAKKKMRE